MFTLEYMHRYSTSEIENWIVFERDIKLDMLNDYIEFKNRQAKENATS